MTPDEITNLAFRRFDAMHRAAAFMIIGMYACAAIAFVTVAISITGAIYPNWALIPAVGFILCFLGGARLLDRGI